jgi:hypothetical protein
MMSVRDKPVTVSLCSPTRCRSPLSHLSEAIVVCYVSMRHCTHQISVDLS